jgi:hypothetical protein
MPILPNEVGYISSERQLVNPIKELTNTPLPLVKNFLIELEELFESESISRTEKSSSGSKDYLLADDVYRKLSKEII